jgi:hypothetical protein
VYFVDIKLNIDGLPLFKSSRLNLWPILMIVNNVLRPLPIAVFCGIGKPNLTPFLNHLCEEISRLTTSGFCYNSLQIKVRKVTCVCDTPARAFVLSLKGHTSFNGCSWCRQTGCYMNDRISFSRVVSEKRTDSDYASFSENNQNSITPFMNIVPMYSCFPIDVMHAVYLGVTRRLLHFYCSSIKGLRLKCKFSALQYQQVNEKIVEFKKFFPSEFQRKPRPLSELEFFKATEFRTFLIYLGPIVLKSILHQNFYHHFLLLHFAMYVYSSSKLSQFYGLAKACIDRFVYQIPELYHPCLISFNFHSLLHIHEFVDMYGPVHNYSAFPFESYMSLIKKRIRANNGIFKQSLGHLINIRALYVNCSSSILTFSPNSPNNCAITQNGEIILIESTNGQLVSGMQLVLSRNLYTYIAKVACKCFRNILLRESCITLSSPAILFFSRRVVK